MFFWAPATTNLLLVVHSYDLMKSCWHPDPEERPDFNLILQTLLRGFTPVGERNQSEKSRRTSSGEFARAASAKRRVSLHHIPSLVCLCSNRSFFSPSSTLIDVTQHLLPLPYCPYRRRPLANRACSAAASQSSPRRLVPQQQSLKPLWKSTHHVPPPKLTPMSTSGPQPHLRSPTRPRMLLTWPFSQETVRRR
jgi:hypothetical protein